MNNAHLIALTLSLFTSTLLHAEGETAKESPKDIPYAVAEEWKIGGSGAGAAIVIDPKHRNEKDMKSLGETLKKKHLQSKFVHIFIYDDEKAAKMRKQVPEKGAAAKSYEKHLIGFYMKNNATKKHDYHFGITSKGVQGKITETKFDLP